MLTKKQFKTQCSFHEYGRGKRKINAIFFDWATDERGTGFKYMISGVVDDILKAELFDYFYEWVMDKIEGKYMINLPWYVNYKHAIRDTKRFKVPLSM